MGHGLPNIIIGNDHCCACTYVMLLPLSRYLIFNSAAVQALLQVAAMAKEPFHPDESSLIQRRGDWWS